ncbi:hypothetical protein AAG570_000282 [Ranatra chinensis]|uniref:glutaminase n=1 Tax=Ranatra chinensis TaxID=642074 RepID=A0ABD0YWX2_9HEMI
MSDVSGRGVWLKLSLDQELEWAPVGFSMKPMGKRRGVGIPQQKRTCDVQVKNEDLNSLQCKREDQSIREAAQGPMVLPPEPTQSCSIEVTTSSLSVMCATLANGGICPFNNQRIISTDNVRCVLSLMQSCGMYNLSGEFAHLVGIPGKAGVSGSVCLVVPGLLGIGMFSPKINNFSCSNRAYELCKGLMKMFAFHPFEDVGLSKNNARSKALGRAKEDSCPGHKAAVLVQNGYKLCRVDHFGRTALHVAAAASQKPVVRYVIERCLNIINKTDVFRASALHYRGAICQTPSSELHPIAILMRTLMKKCDAEKLVCTYWNICFSALCVPTTLACLDLSWTEAMAFDVATLESRLAAWWPPTSPPMTLHLRLTFVLLAGFYLNHVAQISIRKGFSHPNFLAAESFLIFFISTYTIRHLAGILYHTGGPDDVVVSVCDYHAEGPGFNSLRGQSWLKARLASRPLGV